MMTPSERAHMMQQRLTQAFSPSKLEIIDDSHHHQGHPGSKGGAGHYTLKIAAEKFSNQHRLAAHRDIYAVLNDLIPHEIHALRIIIL